MTETTVAAGWRAWPTSSCAEVKATIIPARGFCRSLAAGCRLVSATARTGGSAAMIRFGPSTQSAMVEACVSAYAQTVAMCPGDHWRLNDKGGRDRVKNSALVPHPAPSERLPVDQRLPAERARARSICEGNTYALALRNDRFEIDELHLMDPMLSYPRLATTGDVFYQLYGNDVIREAARRRAADRAAARRAAHPAAHGAPSLPATAGRRSRRSSRPMPTSASALPSRSSSMRST